MIDTRIRFRLSLAVLRVATSRPVISIVFPGFKALVHACHEAYARIFEWGWIYIF